ncbi:MAG: deoxyribodipyrimidine photolyase, partial [Acidobacteria bacterium]|nr:deoxyribodipyrimidine photolyase [Acidobacteriota bacterium]
RGVDNPALDIAIEAGNRLQLPVIVFFGLHPRYPRANLRHYSFLVDGLAETRQRVLDRGAFFLFRPYPEHDLIDLSDQLHPALVVGDENPLREPENWRVSAAKRLNTTFVTVDADVVVPTSFFQKEEYAARTIRPKIHRLLPRFLQPLSNPKAETGWGALAARLEGLNRPINKNELLRDLPIDRAVGAVSTAAGGYTAALRRLDEFVGSGLAQYDTARNIPHQAGTSELSAYLHFGQISPLTIALAVQKASIPEPAREAYLEELIVRRELAINFVKCNPRYDRLEGCHGWAVETLRRHASDKRPFLYNPEQFELGQTHDDLWNAAQAEMVATGRMHGYLRMYWAKKILEWTQSPEEAFEIAIRLNDKYQLDGRDPNGYTGIAWAIGGKHDRPWGPERSVFGLIRYMVYSGCARKFSIPAYIERVAEMSRAV